MRYNHMFDVAFSLETGQEDWEKVPASELLEALERRVAYLKVNPDECVEAFGYSDSYEVDDAL